MVDENIPHEDFVRDVIRDEMGASADTASAAITNASVAHALNASFSDTEVESALNALGAKINDMLAVLREKGFIDT